MKKVFMLVLCFLLVATFAEAGAGAASAKQDNNPRQAGKSQIYFYEVESAQGDGHGKLVIDMNKKIFTFIGHGYTPMQNVHIKVDDEIIAKGIVTKSGNLHIRGDWESSAVPKPGSIGSYYYHDPAYGFKGQHLGGYIAHLKIRYSKDGGNTWYTTTKETGDITLGESYSIVISDFIDDTHEIKKFDLIQLKARVIGGDDTWTSTIFTYIPDADPAYCWPHVYLHGPTWGAYLEYTKDYCQYCLTGECSEYWYTWGEDIW